MFGWEALDSGMGMRMSDSHYGLGSPIPIPIPEGDGNARIPQNPIPTLPYYSNPIPNSDSNLEPNALGDMAMPILITIHSDSDYSQEPNAPLFLYFNRRVLIPISSLLKEG